METRTSFCNFFSIPIIKLKDNCDLNYFKECCYIDYRVGCSICERGDAYAFKTNMLHLIDKDNQFNTKDLDIIVEFDDKDKSFPIYYETRDENTIELLFQYFKKIDYLSDHFSGINPQNYIRGEINISSSGIGSIFRKDNSFDYISNSKSIKHAHICNLCFKWLNILHENISEQFMEIDSFKIFWEDFIIDDLQDMIKDQTEIKFFLKS
jgi:hypothetical protein